MIDIKTFNDLKGHYPFIGNMPPKLQEIIRGEISPNQPTTACYEVQIGNKPGAVLVSEGSNEMTAYWMTKLLFKKFPTLQKFNFSQVNELTPSGELNLFIHASVDANNRTDDYEEGTFTFKSSAEKEALMNTIKPNATRLS